MIDLDNAIPYQPPLPPKPFPQHAKGTPRSNILSLTHPLPQRPSSQTIQPEWPCKSHQQRLIDPSSVSRPSVLTSVNVFDQELASLHNVGAWTTVPQDAGPSSEEQRQPINVGDIFKRDSIKPRNVRFQLGDNIVATDGGSDNLCSEILLPGSRRSENGPETLPSRQNGQEDIFNADSVDVQSGYHHVRITSTTDNETTRSQFPPQQYTTTNTASESSLRHGESVSIFGTCSLTDKCEEKADTASQDVLGHSGHSGPLSTEIEGGKTPADYPPCQSAVSVSPSDGCRDAAESSGCTEPAGSQRVQSNCPFQKSSSMVGNIHSADGLRPGRETAGQVNVADISKDALEDAAYPIDTTRASSDPETAESSVRGDSTDARSTGDLAQYRDPGVSITENIDNHHASGAVDNMGKKRSTDPSDALPNQTPATGCMAQRIAYSRHDPGPCDSNQTTVTATICSEDHPASQCSKKRRSRHNRKIAVVVPRLPPPEPRPQESPERPRYKRLRRQRDRSASLEDDVTDDLYDPVYDSSDGRTIAVTASKIPAKSRPYRSTNHPHGERRKRRRDRPASLQDGSDDDAYVDVAQRINVQRHPTKKLRPVPTNTTNTANTGQCRRGDFVRTLLKALLLQYLETISRATVNCEIFPDEIIHQFSWSEAREGSDTDIRPNATLCDQIENSNEMNSIPDYDPHKSPKGKSAKVPWTKEEDAKLKRLRKRGWTLSQIKKEFDNRTEGAIQMRCYSKNY